MIDHNHLLSKNKRITFFNEDIVSQDMDSDFNYDRPRVFHTAEREREEIAVELTEEAAAQEKCVAIIKEMTHVDMCLADTKEDIQILKVSSKNSKSSIVDNENKSHSKENSQGKKQEEKKSITIVEESSNY